MINDNYLDARIRHNETMAQLLTKAATIPIDDPVVQEQKRQRAIIEKALVSLASGNTQRTRELLGTAMNNGALILYGSPKKLTNAHKPVHHNAPYCKGPYYVRIEFVPNVDCEGALGKVKLQEGETLLNTIDYEPS